MPVYHYRARDRHGRTVAAVIEATDVRSAVRILREKGFYVTEIKEPPRGLQLEINLSFLESGPSLKDIAIFSRQLATMLASGLPIVQALQVLEKQTENKKFKAIIRAVRTDVEGGSPFSEALAKHRIFSRLYINLVRAGEASGALDSILDRLATFLEKDLAIRGKVKSAMTYPAVVFSFAILVTYFLLTTIVPQFAQILTELGSGLPPLTRLLIALSDLMRKSGLFLLLLPAALYGLYVLAYRRPKGRRVIDGFKLRMPVFGTLAKKSALARFSRTLGLLLSSGVNIVEAVEITKGTAGNAVIEEILDETRENIEVGESIHSTLARYPKVFPPMVASMVAIGEETGALDAMLEKVADFYEREVDETVSSLTALIEPVIIIFLGLIVGTIVAGMFLPLFQIINTLSAQ